MKLWTSPFVLDTESCMECDGAATRKNVPQDSKSERSSDLADRLGRLAVVDDPSAIFSDPTSSSSKSSDGHNASIQVLRRERLNHFLRSCGKEECVIGQPQKRWKEMDVHRKNVYVHRATTAIVAALDVIAPGDAGHLWEA